MQNLRESDATNPHRRNISYHISKLRKGKTPLHAELRAKAIAVRDDLKAKQRAHEDAQDALAEATAEVDSTEIDFENAIRDLDNDLERFDRDYPGKGARAAIFPDGYGAVIEPEGDRQLEVLPKLHTRIEPFQGEAPLAPALTKLAGAEKAFKDALKTEEAADDAVDAAFARELGARAAVRAQLTSAHGLLRDLHKTNPSQAERYFMKMGRKEGKRKGGGGGGGGGEGGEGGGG